MANTMNLVENIRNLIYHGPAIMVDMSYDQLGLLSTTSTHDGSVYIHGAYLLSRGVETLSSYLRANEGTEIYMKMEQHPRTPGQIREHYEIEKRLAQRLLSSTREERQTLYTSLYDELFREVQDHPQLTIKSSPEASAKNVAYEMKHLRPFLKGDTVFLEIGPGDCALSFEVAKGVRTVYAIDVSEEITRNGLHPPNFNLILTDGASISVPPASVNVAYSNQLMEHLHPDDALEQLHNIYNALVPGGIYMCVTPNRLNGPHDISKYFDRVATGFHLKEYTVTELSYLFRTAGFTKVKVLVSQKHIRAFLPVLLVRICEKMLGLLPYSLRRALASSRPVAKLLGIRLVGTK